MPERLPDGIRLAVEAALERVRGRPGRVVGSWSVGGGCISPTARVETDDGATFFLKRGRADLPADLLDAEARGLRALAGARAVRVPAVVAGGGSGADAWLLLEWLEPGTGGRDAWAGLGRSIAHLHGHRAGEWGAERDNYIGSLPQENGWSGSWADFWRERRLAPQLEAALRSGLLGPEDEAAFERLFDRLGELLAPAEEDGPSLLHGDLWSGNVHMLDDGGAAVIDPSVYHGHREVDLAMADLFGGFAPSFRAAYEEAWPLARGYEPVRRSIYQLYYLLVHVNLFGAGYVRGARDALRATGAGR